MRRLLVLTPHFPPTDAVDMHRVRMNVGYYEQHGWAPTVLTVRAQDAGRLVDRNLAHTVPAELDVREAGAIPQRLCAPLGISAIGLRAFGSLRARGDAILRAERFDLVFISTTAFPLMALGARWRRTRGVPCVLDFQDPWHTAPPTTAPFRRRGLKHRLMQRLHAALERRVMAAANGIIAVSADYIAALRGAFPRLDDIPCEAIPFGFAASDFDAAQRYGRALALPRNHSAVVFMSAGRAGADMRRTLEALFHAATRAVALGLEPFASARLVFLGTGYGLKDNPKIVEPIAQQRAAASRVLEIPDRIPLLDSLKTLSQCDVLVLLGSDDLAYQPSKLFQCLHMNKPILCVAPARSRLAAAVDGLDSVVFLPSDAPPADDMIRAAAARLEALLRREDVRSPERLARAAGHEAKATAARECAVFDRACGLRSA